MVEDILQNLVLCSVMEGRHLLVLYGMVEDLHHHLYSDVDEYCCQNRLVFVLESPSEVLCYICSDHNILIDVCIGHNQVCGTVLRF